MQSSQDCTELDRKITAIKVQKKNPRRVNLHLDGEYAFGLSRFVAAWLQVGQELTEQKISDLKAEDARETAYQQTLKLLNFRQRSQAEVERNLRDHQYSSDVIEAVIERLQSAGLLDDSRFAQSWVDNRNEFRPRGKSLLRMELRQRGLDDKAIATAVDDIDESELAYQAGLKQARKYKDLEWNQFRQKLYAFLARRGFNYENISPVVERIWHESQSDRLE